MEKESRANFDFQMIIFLYLKVISKICQFGWLNRNYRTCMLFSEVDNSLVIDQYLFDFDDIITLLMIFGHFVELLANTASQPIITLANTATFLFGYPNLGLNPLPPGGGSTCYDGVLEDVPFSWAYFLPENSKAGYTFCPKILK